ncbi:MAG TPA: MarR family transcriptional regulator [Herpetosiphon sp.]|uniref:Transcriptional regulator, MarR family n=1 Tax=Herpetosiphon aurantiacus (strain ATCC 23779 / DSM 785 / 114-95) TaxID=316274 RepID=A9AVB6_HERA2|nr:MarR family transcriptional regulator [Herpetosiphon sp.]ABX04607.1 transcriptional regulator, MarR family [Herpetosiphon aurantiacus DSM 785]HBW48682.1 MarR family transcriptional regulator [Herpetosiphon sp.]
MQRHYIDRLVEDLFTLAPQLHRLVDLEVRRQLDGATSAAQLRMLNELQHGPQSLSSLARQQHVSPQAISELLPALVERGWIERIPHPQDRRQQLLQLTNAGLDAVRQAQTQAHKQLTAHVASLSEVELSIVAAALPALQRLLDLAKCADE